MILRCPRPRILREWELLWILRIREGSRTIWIYQLVRLLSLVMSTRSLGNAVSMPSSYSWEGSLSLPVQAQPCVRFWIEAVSIPYWSAAQRPVGSGTIAYRSAGWSPIESGSRPYRSAIAAHTETLSIRGSSGARPLPVYLIDSVIRILSIRIEFPRPLLLLLPHTNY